EGHAHVDAGNVGVGREQDDEPVGELEALEIDGEVPGGGLATLVVGCDRRRRQSGQEPEESSAADGHVHGRDARAPEVVSTKKRQGSSTARTMRSRRGKISSSQALAFS